MGLEGAAAAEITLAEAFCNGSPLSDASTGAPVYGPPLSNAEVFTAALANMDQALTLATNLLYGARITDMETCYKIMAGDVARALTLEANRFDIEPEITAKLLKGGHRILELPVKFEPRSRAQGKKIGWRDGVHAVQVLLKHRFRE